ncbi:hypothetical protein M427DRAFT_171564 [Gonapodya prolifera JEL478]|uniref:Uncharacterized protein n=1 Tax=Gonapodya prolifera (strain JEL478) TaxID=1344416 RepID=A0A139B067_GONPJ|nr:hypothetical protein M427DRAFT_171564 [Gonapodya prolifera JEL478]|eukprot:KXS22386.1 hypothetical protein M427DRAFT_171564 [Gonapodya prolifera JEL478]
MDGRAEHGDGKAVGVVRENGDAGGLTTKEGAVAVERKSSNENQRTTSGANKSTDDRRVSAAMSKDTASDPSFGGLSRVSREQSSSSLGVPHISTSSSSRVIPPAPSPTPPTPLLPPPDIPLSRFPSDTPSTTSTVGPWSSSASGSSILSSSAGSWFVPSVPTSAGANVTVQTQGGSTRLASSFSGGMPPRGPSSALSQRIAAAPVVAQVAVGSVASGDEGKATPTPTAAQHYSTPASTSSTPPTSSLPAASPPLAVPSPMPSLSSTTPTLSGSPRVAPPTTLPNFPTVTQGTPPSTASPSPIYGFPGKSAWPGNSRTGIGSAYGGEGALYSQKSSGSPPSYGGGYPFGGGGFATPGFGLTVYGGGQGSGAMNTPAASGTPGTPGTTGPLGWPGSTSGFGARPSGPTAGGTRVLLSDYMAYSSPYGTTPPGDGKSVAMGTPVRVGKGAAPQADVGVPGTPTITPPTPTTGGAGILARGTLPVPTGG